MKSQYWILPIALNFRHKPIKLFSWNTWVTRAFKHGKCFFITLNNSHAFNDKNCVIVGVSFGSYTDNKAFKEKAEYPYDLLTDNDKSASTTFGVVTSDTGNPSRVSVLIAPDGSIAKTYDTVAPVEHADQVLADLTSLD